MDLIAGLGVVGSYISGKNNKDKPKSNIGVIKRTPICGDNVYNSNKINRDKKYMRKIAEGRYNQASDVSRSGVVPNIKYMKDNKINRIAKIPKIEGLNVNSLDDKSMNSNDSVFSDYNDNMSCISKISKSKSLDSLDFYKRSQMFKDKQPTIINNNISNEPSYFSQFNDLTFDNIGNPVSKNKTDPSNNNEFSTFQTHDDMTYGVVSGDKFVHNNMVPFFKGTNSDRVTQRKLDDVHQRKMESFTGSSKNVEYRPKTERKPLFNPQVGLTWMYGMPNFTNYMSSRYIPSRERRNEQLQQPVRITPGLNLGYNEVSKQGYHDTYRILPKTVDELRAANDPKISYGTVLIPGMKGHRRPIISNVAKRHPITYKEQDPRDFVKGRSYYTGPSIYGNFEAPSTNRQMTTKEWYAPAGADPTQPKPQSMLEKCKKPLRENFKHAEPRNTTGVEREKNVTATSNTYYVQPTNRQLYEKTNWVNPAGPEYRKGSAFDMKSNIPDNTNRNLTEVRSWINAAGPEYKRGVAFDEQLNIPDPTGRNLTEGRSWINAAGPEYKRGVAFDEYTNIPDPTGRNLTEGRTWINAAGPEYQRGLAFDMQTNIPDPTGRSLTENRTWINAAGPEYQRGVAFNEKLNIPDPTNRNLTEGRTWINPAGPEFKKGVAFDQQLNIPDPTNRNLTEGRTWINGAGPEFKKGVAFDQQLNIPDPTNRNLTEGRTWINPAGPEFKKGVAFDQQLNIPDPTNRNLTEVRTWINPAGPEFKKGVAFDQQLNIPDPTNRNLTEVRTWINPAGPEFKKGGYHVEQAGTVAKPTLRMLTENKTHQGPLGFPEKEKGGYHVAQAGTVAKTTLRQLTQNKTIQAPAFLHEGTKTRNRMDANQSHVNVSKDMVTIIRDSGAPTTCNYEKIPTYEHTMVELCEPVQVNRELYGDMHGQRPLQCLPTAHIRVANVLPQSSWRFDTCIVDNLKNNPYINNTQHKAVEY